MFYRQTNPTKSAHMEDRLVKVKTYERMEEALLDQRVLSENNIECNIQESTSAGILPMLYDLDEGIALLVFEQDIEKADKILTEYHQADAAV